MRAPMEYFAEIERIVGDPVRGDTSISVSFEAETVAEARDLQKRLGLMQRELRLLKKEVKTDIREIKAHYVSQRSNVQAGFWASALGGRGGAARDRKGKREDAKRQEAQAVFGYEEIDRSIDSMLFQIDQAKLNADRMVKSAAPEPKPRAAALGAKGDPAERLRALKTLLDQGLITQEEHDQKRADILKDV